MSAILSFTSRDGHRYFTLDQLAHTLALPRHEAEERLAELVAVSWRDDPIAVLERDSSGTISGAVLAPLEVLAHVKSRELPPRDTTPGESVSNYANAHLYHALAEVGLESDQIAHLLRAFPEERIQRQLAWLPSRDARNPAALLIRAVEQNWEAPREAA